MKTREEWLSVRDLCRELSISRSHGYSLVAAGHFRAVKIGGCVRVTRRSVDEYLERQAELFAYDHGIADEIYSDASYESEDSLED